MATSLRATAPHSGQAKRNVAHATEQDETNRYYLTYPLIYVGMKDKNSSIQNCAASNEKYNHLL